MTYSRWLVLSLALAACSSPRMAVDPILVSESDVLNPQLEQDPSGRMRLGSFILERLGPITSSRIDRDDTPSLATHRFEFELKDEDTSLWRVSCSVRMNWISRADDESVQELSCEITDATAQGNLPYRLSVGGTGPVLGLKSGTLALGEAILDIESAHGEASPPRSIGRLVGFELSHENRLLGSVQTVEPVTIWIARRRPEQLRSLATACAIALAFYEQLSSGA